MNVLLELTTIFILIVTREVRGKSSLISLTCATIVLIAVSIDSIAQYINIIAIVIILFLAISKR